MAIIVENLDLGCDQAAITNPNAHMARYAHSLVNLYIGPDAQQGPLANVNLNGTGPRGVNNAVGAHFDYAGISDMADSFDH